MPCPKLLTAILAAVLMLGAIDAAAARHKKHSVRQQDSSGFWSGLVPTDRDGNPIIIQGYRPSKAKRDEAPRRQRADRPVRIPRGSSTYITPVNPSPNSPNSPPAAALTRPVPQPVQPPPVNTYGDRVTNCIHSYPLNAGVGNNPRDQQSYVRQCAN
jgi:hypothetical protein